MSEQVHDGWVRPEVTTPASQRRGIDIWARRLDAEESPLLDAALEKQHKAIRRIEAELGIAAAELP